MKHTPRLLIPTSWSYVLVLTLVIPVVGIRSAAATTIDFESSTGQYVAGQSFTVNGYTFTNSGPPSEFLGITSPGCYPGCASNGSVHTLSATNSSEPSFTVTATNGGPFDLAQFEGAEAFTQYDFLWASQIVVVGTLAGGGTVSSTFALDLINDGGGGVADFQTFVLPQTFQNLASVRFTGTGPNFADSFSVDNVVVNSLTAVPEPTSMLLLGTGLIGAGVRRYRQQRAKS